MAGLGNVSGCIELLNQFWAVNKSSTDAFAAVATCLIDLGQDAAALEVVEEAIASQGENERICQIIGELAFKLNMPHIAVRSFSKASAINPAEPSHQLHLANAYDAMDQQDSAIALLQSMLELSPTYAPAWDALGILLCNYRSDFKNGRLFIQEAIRLDPKNAKYHYNLASTFAQNTLAEPHYLEALECEPDNPQIRLSYALFLLAKSRHQEAWPYYQARLDPSFGSKKVAVYDHGAPEWKGEDLTGKSILVCAEQGIGDEVYFSTFLAYISDVAERVFVGCDPRLVRLYNRSFKNCTAFGFKDKISYRQRVRSFEDLAPTLKREGAKIDYATTVGSIPFHLKLTTQSVRTTKGNIFKPQAELMTSVTKRLSAFEGRKLYGISWRSSNTSGVRRFYYLGADFVAALAQKTDAEFFVVQYAYSPEERQTLEPIENVHFLDDVDMREDIEYNVALFSKLNCSIGPPTATQMFAMAAGCRVCLINNGAPWTISEDGPKPPQFAPNSRLVLLKQNNQFKSNADLVSEVSATLAAG